MNFLLEQFDSFGDVCAGGDVRLNVLVSGVGVLRVKL